MTEENTDPMKVTDQDVIYSDNHLIAVNKKAGQIVQGDKTGDTPLSELVKEYVRVKFNKKGEAFLGVIHRIDRPVSGVVVFARTSKGLARMNDLFKHRKVEKKYLAVVGHPPPSESGELTHWLIKNQEKNKSRSYTDEVKGSLEARLTYKVQTRSDNYTLLEIKPETGRHHQIRVQLSAIGSPIKGDLKYGAPRSNKDASIHLHSRSLSFIHPVSGEQIEIIAPLPDDNLWDFFSEKLV